MIACTWKISSMWISTLYNKFSLVITLRCMQINEGCTCMVHALEGVVHALEGAVIITE